MGCCSATATAAKLPQEHIDVSAPRSEAIAPCPASQPGELQPSVADDTKPSSSALAELQSAAVGEHVPTAPGTDFTASDHVPALKGGSQVLGGRYRLRGKEPLGEGGWCEVWAADCLIESSVPKGTKVAVKTFHRGAMRATDCSTLEARFTNEVAIFRKLELSRSLVSDGIRKEEEPRQLFVNLLDYTNKPVEYQMISAVTPEDGRFFSVLELAEYSLDTWLNTCLEKRDFVDFVDVQKIARVLADGLAWLQSKGLCHLDVKPANVMRFGDLWKIIDLEGALPLLADAELSTDSFTPLYTAPEVGKAILLNPAVVDGSTRTIAGMAPATAIDMWAAGVVLMDVLAHESVFQETWTGFQMQAVLSGDVEEPGIGFKKDWYEWLSGPEAIVPVSYVTSPLTSVSLLKGVSELQELLVRLLDKDPSQRLSAQDFREHKFLKLEADSVELPDAGKERCVTCGKALPVLLDVTMGATHEGWGLGNMSCKYSCARCGRVIEPGIYVNACRNCRCMWHKGGAEGCDLISQSTQDVTSVAETGSEYVGTNGALSDCDLVSPASQDVGNLPDTGSDLAASRGLIIQVTGATRPSTTCRWCY